MKDIDAVTIALELIPSAINLFNQGNRSPTLEDILEQSCDDDHITSETKRASFVNDLMGRIHILIPELMKQLRESGYVVVPLCKAYYKDYPGAALPTTITAARACVAGGGRNNSVGIHCCDPNAANDLILLAYEEKNRRSGAGRVKKSSECVCDAVKRRIISKESGREHYQQALLEVTPANIRSLDPELALSFSPPKLK